MSYHSATGLIQVLAIYGQRWFAIDHGRLFYTPPTSVRAVIAEVESRNFTSPPVPASAGLTRVRR